MKFWLVITLTCVCALIAVYIKQRRPPPGQTEIKLTEPQKKETSLIVHELSPEAKDRYRAEWAVLVSAATLDPEVTIRKADRLLQNIMRERGYPTGDFGRVLEDLTAEQAELLDAYRFAHRVSVKAETDMIPEAELARAMAALHAVFEGLGIT